ncbi:chemosensory protein 11 precursor [Danaus plexippus plexippus]|uniref:Chemosensory protein 11 n=1 Tax=Danaus plexippus plexippus TaxID=278856 RepID=A0A212F7U7_DANPL|nr:chemosensory protein 11 precursor [Danaus plexippus plexippus]
MKIFILLLCVFAAVIAEENSDLSTENIDLTEVVGNDKLIESYANCLINKGPCTPEMEKIKEAIPEALETTCGKCSPKQKQLIRKVIKAIIEKQPQAWEQLVEKYDTEKKYRESFNKFIEEEN